MSTIYRGHLITLGDGGSYSVSKDGVQLAALNTEEKALGFIDSIVDEAGIYKFEQLNKED